jgi:hypothetical protein
LLFFFVPEMGTPNKSTELDIMNDIKKLLTLADTDSVTQDSINCGLGTSKLRWAINGVAMYGQYSAGINGVYGVGFEFDGRASDIESLAGILGKGFAE